MSPESAAAAVLLCPPAALWRVVRRLRLRLCRAFAVLLREMHSVCEHSVSPDSGLLLLLISLLLRLLLSISFSISFSFSFERNQPLATFEIYSLKDPRVRTPPGLRLRLPLHVADAAGRRGRPGTKKDP